MSGPNDRKILKRFANLDIDGVQRPPKPAPARSRPAASPPRAEETAARSGPQRAVPRTTSPPPEPSRRPEPSRAREPLGGRRAGMTVEALRLDVAGGGPAQPLEIPPGATPGVYTVEFTPAPRAAPRVASPGERGSAGPPLRLEERALLALDALPRAFAPPEAAARRAWSEGPALAARAEPEPITLTELAARQIRLMAWQHGVAGAGLRILTSGPGGPDHCDFAFESEPEPGDVVFLSQGVRIFIDRASLRTLRGMRITYQDLPGAAGFAVG